jgi:hypothetical protein
MPIAERKISAEPLRRIAGEWKYRMPVIIPVIMFINSENIKYQVDLINVIIAGGIGFAAGFVMDYIEKGDPERMVRWFKP